VLRHVLASVMRYFVPGVAWDLLAGGQQHILAGVIRYFVPGVAWDLVAGVPLIVVINGISTAPER
jgi:hypothetical protein